MRILTSFSSGLATAMLVAAVGCQPAPTPPVKPKTSGGKSQAEDHGHPHEGEGAHAHGAGPHDGTLADWGGGKYHVEFTVDHDKQKAVVYVLGSDENSAVPIKAAEGKLLLTINDPSFQVDLMADPLDGETESNCSRYVGKHEHLGIVQEFAGTISGDVDGTPYAGDFKEEPHGAHGHAHGHSHGEDDALVWEGDPEMVDGLTILLGHHGKQLHAGKEVEPAVSITRDGKPVSNAKVFNSLLSGDGETVLAEEVATIYEPTTDEEPAHYAQGGLAIPKGAKKVIIRFRIEVPGSDSATFDVPVAVD